MTRWLYTLADYPRQVLYLRAQGWSLRGALRSAWMTATPATREACLISGVYLLGFAACAGALGWAVL